jgi:hypothetical protein
MREHSKSKKFDSYVYINCPREDLNVLESLYIHVLRPPLQGKSSQGDSLAAPISLSRLLKMGRRDA